MSTALLLMLASLIYLAGGQDNFACIPQKTFPHPFDCSRYYYCDNMNIQQVFYCSPGFFFNPKTEQCDLPDTEPCPYLSPLPVSVQPSDTSLPDEELPENPQSYAPLIPTGSVPSPPLLPSEGQVVGQSFVPSLPVAGETSVPSLPVEEQPSEPSPSGSDGIVFGQSYVPPFLRQGGLDFQQPAIEDRKDDMEDITYENKTEQTSESYSRVFTALQNFEKTLEEGRQKEEEDTNEEISEIVDVKRKERSDQFIVSSLVTSTEKPEVSEGKEGEIVTDENKELPVDANTEIFEGKGSTEEGKVKGCSAGTNFFARLFPTSTVNQPTQDGDDQKNTNEESSTSVGAKEDKIESENVGEDNANPDTVRIVWPLYPPGNLTVVEENIGKDLPTTSDSPSFKSIEVESQNETEEEKNTFNYPIYTVLNLKATSPLNHTEGNADEVKEKSQGNAEEIEEAKSTIIFESHTDEEENENAGIPDIASGVVIKETAIL